MVVVPVHHLWVISNASCVAVMIRMMAWQPIYFYFRVLLCIYMHICGLHDPWSEQDMWRRLRWCRALDKKSALLILKFEISVEDATDQGASA